jgi:hypothetical protein
VTLLWLFAFAAALLGGLGLFLVLEGIALSKKDDDLHTLSTYIKRARRKHPILGAVVLTVAIVSPAVWLWGHLVLEAW